MNLEILLRSWLWFHKGNNVDAINRIMDPDTIADITLREGIYEFDPI